MTKLFDFHKLIAVSFQVDHHLLLIVRQSFHLTSFVFVGNQSQSSLPMTRTKEIDNGLVEAGDRSWL